MIGVGMRFLKGVFPGNYLLKLCFCSSQRISGVVEINITNISESVYCKRAFVT